MELIAVPDSMKKIYVALALLLGLSYKISITSKFAELPRCIDGYL